VVLTPKINFFINASQFVSAFEWNAENIRKADIAFFNKQSSCDKQLRNIPTIRANAGFSMDVYRFRVFAGFNYGSKSQNNKRFYLEENHFANIPSYFQGNFNISYHINKKIKIQFSANNIGQKYSDPDESTNIDNFGQNGLLQPSETFLLGGVYEF
jgi:outer membrane receptor protein involved in Fe transport